MSNPLSDSGVTDAQWDSMTAAEKRAAIDAAVSGLDPNNLGNFGVGKTPDGKERPSALDTAKTAVSEASTSWLSPLLARLSFGLNVTGAFVLGVLLIIIGVVILVRKPLGSVVSPGGKIGAVTEIAGAIGGE